MQTSGLLCLAVYIKMCHSTCFHEEQSTTPMQLLQIIPNSRSLLLCVKECFNAPSCVSASCSDWKRICHLQTTPPIGSPFCNVVPFRRFVKTEANCVAPSAFFSVDYARQNITREIGIDPCFADLSLIHPELVNLDGMTNGQPPCPIRKLDGSQEAWISMGITSHSERMINDASHTKDQ